MILERKQSESSSQPMTLEKDVCVPTACGDADSSKFDNHGHANQNASYFIAKVNSLIVLNIIVTASGLTPCFMEID